MLALFSPFGQFSLKFKTYSSWWDNWFPVIRALWAFVGLTFTLPYIQCHLLWQSNSKGRYDENVWLQSRWWQDATYDHITRWKGRLVFCLTLTLLQVASIFKFLQFWKIKEILCTCKPFHIDQQLANALTEMSVSYLHHPLGLRSQNKQPKGDSHTVNLHKSAICRNRNRNRWYIHKLNNIILWGRSGYERI